MKGVTFFLVLGRARGRGKQENVVLLVPPGCVLPAWSVMLVLVRRTPFPHFKEATAYYLLYYMLYDVGVVVCGTITHSYQ